ncbi:MAG TPA: hypothetical protein VM012_05265, partial [Flavitalea sp.]|nr:hypothetical protein [Flavitalea sp.]
MKFKNSHFTVNEDSAAVTSVLLNTEIKMMMIKKITTILIAVIYISCTTSRPPVTAIPLNPFHYTAQKKIICSKGAVVSAHPLASEAGVQILKLGGNAIDAAIAT